MKALVQKQINTNTFFLKIGKENIAKQTTNKSFSNLMQINNKPNLMMKTIEMPIELTVGELKDFLKTNNAEVFIKKNNQYINVTNLFINKDKTLINSKVIPNKHVPNQDQTSDNKDKTLLNVQNTGDNQILNRYNKNVAINIKNDKNKTAENSVLIQLVINDLNAVIDSDLPPKKVTDTTSKEIVDFTKKNSRQNKTVNRVAQNTNQIKSFNKTEKNRITELSIGKNDRFNIKKNNMINIRENREPQSNSLNKRTIINETNGIQRIGIEKNKSIFKQIKTKPSTENKENTQNVNSSTNTKNHAKINHDYVMGSKQIVENIAIKLPDKQQSFIDSKVKVNSPKNDDSHINQQETVNNIQNHRVYNTKIIKTEAIKHLKIEGMDNVSNKAKNPTTSYFKTEKIKPDISNMQNINQYTPSLAFQNQRNLLMKNNNYLLESAYKPKAANTNPLIKENVYKAFRRVKQPGGEVILARNKLININKVQDNKKTTLYQIKHKTVTTNDVSEKVILKNNDKQFGLNNKSQHNGVFLNLKKDTNVKPVSLPNTINMQNISPKYDVGEITQPYNAQTKQNKQNITKINFVENISLHKNHNTFENVEHINLNSGAKVNFVNADNSQIEEPGKTSSAGIISKNIKSKTLERTNESSILISGSQNSQTLKTNTKFMQASNKSLIVKASAFETTPRLKKDQENTTKQLNVHKLKIVGDNVRNKGNIEKLDLNYTIIKDENKSIKPKLSTYEHKASDYKHGKQVNRINKDDYKEIKPHISTPKDQKQTDQSQSNSVYKIKDKANINIKAENNEVKPYVNVQQDIKQSEFIAKKSNSGDIYTKKEFDNYNTISKLVLSDIKTARNAANIAETTTGKILKEPFKSNYAQSYKKYKEKHITELIDNNKDISSQKAKAVSIEVRKFNSVPQVKTSSYKITDIKMKKTITPPFKNNNITDRKQNVDNVKVDKENPIEQVKGIRINQITNNQLTGKTKLDRRESISSPVTKTDKQEQIISKSQFRESDLVPLVKTSSYKITDIKMKKTKENPIEQVNGIRKNQITNNPLTGKTNLDRRESISSSETKTDKQEQINSVNKFNNVINKNKIADAIDNNYHNNISKHDTTIRLTKDIKIDHKAISTKNPKESELIRDSIVKQGLDKSNEENIQIQSGDATKGIKTSNHTIETGRISNQSVSSSLLSGEEKILPKQNVFEKNLHTNTSDDAEFTNAPIDGQLWHRTSHDVLAQQLHNTSLNSKTNLKGNDEMQGFEDTFVHKNAIAYETIQDYLDNNEPLFVQYLDTDGKEKQRSVFIKNNDAKNTQNSSSNSTQNRAISNNKHKENSEYKQDQNQQNFNSFNQMNSKAFSNINSGFNITGSRYSISDFIPKLLETTQSFNREHSIKKAVLEIETNELGYVKTNIEKQGERLIIRFEAEDIQKVKSLKENMHTLEHQLKAQGFEDVLIEYDFHKESRQQSNNQASQQNTSKNQNNQKDNHESLQEEVHTIKRDYGYNSMEYTI